MRPAIRRLLVITLVALLAATGTACGFKKKKRGDSTRAAPTSSDLETKGAEQGNGGGQVTKVGKRFLIKPDSRSKAVISLDSYRTLPPNEDDSFPPENGAFTAFTIRLKSVKGSVHYNPLYLKLKPPRGEALDNNDGNANYVDIEPDVDPSDIPPGKMITTAVVMDAKLQPGTKLIYTSALGQTVATWRV